MRDPRPRACTVETTMPSSDAAARMKNGSCKIMTISNALERQSPRNVFEIPPRA